MQCRRRRRRRRRRHRRCVGGIRGATTNISAVVGACDCCRLAHGIGDSSCQGLAGLAIEESCSSQLRFRRWCALPCTAAAVTTDTTPPPPPLPRQQRLPSASPPQSSLPPPPPPERPGLRIHVVNAVRNARVLRHVGASRSESRCVTQSLTPTLPMLLA